MQQLFALLPIQVLQQRGKRLLADSLPVAGHLGALLGEEQAHSPAVFRVRLATQQALRFQHLDLASELGLVAALMTRQTLGLLPGREDSCNSNDTSGGPSGTGSAASGSRSNWRNRFSVALKASLSGSEIFPGMATPYS